MVITRYLGRLGNNLFQYSLGRILAEKLGYPLQANSIEGFVGTEDVFNIPDETYHGGLMPHNHIRFVNQILKINDKPVGVNDITHNNPFIKKRNVVLDGWFQRYEYYRGHKYKIKEWLRIEDIDVGQTPDDIIIHLRLGDCILGDLAADPYVMPFDYYEKALNSTSFDKLYICSDPETLSHPMFEDYMEKFSKYSPTLLGGNALEDFRAIKSFNKIIMSQSSFSWWAAFLSSASEIFSPVPMPGPHGHEWSIDSPGVAIFVDDEDRYKYIKQYEDGWKLVNLEDIPET